MPHVCHADGCQTAVPPTLLMCRKHWYMVPKGVRDMVWRCYRPGQERDKLPSRLYLVVARLAIVNVAYKEGRLSEQETLKRLNKLQAELETP